MRKTASIGKIPKPSEPEKAPYRPEKGASGTLGSFLALTPHKYQKSHSESEFPIFINMFFLLDAPHFGV